MKIIDAINYYMNILVVAVVLVVAIIIALMYYFIKVRRIAAAEEKLHYDSFDRRSVMEYIKFDDIISDSSGKGMNGAGMIVIDNMTFVAGIDVVGYNYAHASAAEKQQTMMNAIAFANTIEEPIQMRQTVEAIDIEFNISQFESARAELVREQSELERQYQDLYYQITSRDNDPGVKEVILENAERIEKRINSCKWKIKEADEVIRYEHKLQENTSQNDRVNQIMFSYHYNPSESTEELEPEEIQIKAMTALKTRIGVMSSSVAAIGCVCTPLSAEQLISLLHRHMHPNTADKISVNDVIESDSSMLCITSDSLFELERDRLGEEAFYAQLEAAAQMYDESILVSEEAREEEIAAMQAEIRAYDEYIMGGVAE